MKHITKGPEPAEWKAYRTTEGVDFSAEPELKNALLKEQGFLCCYCMCRIEFDKMKVEHFVPRSVKPALKFEYNNLLGACMGLCAAEENCDTRKKNTEISINPLSRAPNCENVITYSAFDGAILTEEAYFKDVNITLNLNDTRIKRNRKEVLNGAINGLNLLHKNKGVAWSKTNIDKIIENYSRLNKDGKYREYCQIVVFYLQKKSAQAS